MTTRNANGALEFLLKVRAQARAGQPAGQRAGQLAGTYICDYCGFPYFPARSDTRYCQNACRQAAYRQRKQGKETP